MSSQNNVYVKSISPQTSEKEIKEFFSFCGKITDIKVEKTGDSQEAVVTFEKPTAAKTALLLDNTQLGASQVSVSSSATSDEEETYTHNAERDTDEITQEEKPRSRIIAEYLAHGYVISDAAVQRAIDLDHKHNVSNRFLQTLQHIDSKYKATDKARSVDQTYGVTEKANNLLSGLMSYYEKAAETPTGQKLVKFYTQTSRQVQDVHNEAKRLAELKKKQAAGTDNKTTCKCGSNSALCTCAPGACNCVNCAKSDVKTVPGTDMTTCNCGGRMSECVCQPGHCACSACPKAQGKHKTSQDGAEPESFHQECFQARACQAFLQCHRPIFTIYAK
jgi:RNA recognition motif. (a.k.a. RRM, RBD, or RNP domain)